MSETLTIRQSTLASYQRCPNQLRLKTVAADRGHREHVLSATAFGTVMHHAVQVLEQLTHEGNEDAVERAVATFEYHWHPDVIGELVPGGIDTWLPRQTRGGLLIRGRENLRFYGEVLSRDSGRLLALELPFHIPMGPLGPHDVVFHGTVDRLALRLYGTKPYLSIEDFKTGQKPTHLRHALQFTAYTWASVQPQFWQAWEPENLDLLREPLRAKGLALYDDGSGLPIIPRRGRWIALRDTFGIHDAGWRTAADFARLHEAVGAYIAAVDADVYPLRVSGETCTYCPFMYSGECGGVPYDKDSEGMPYNPGQ
jgi:hypothetical protein